MVRRQFLDRFAFSGKCRLTYKQVLGCKYAHICRYHVSSGKMYDVAYDYVV